MKELELTAITDRWIHIEACSAKTGEGLEASVQAARSALAPLRRACGARHLVLAAAHRQLAAALRLKLGGSAAGGGGGETGRPAGADAATLLLLECSVELWSTQRLLLGDAHPECAQTLHDIGTALQAMLTHAPQLLFRNRTEWGTAARAAHAERTALRLHARIAALYEGHVSL